MEYKLQKTKLWETMRAIIIVHQRGSCDLRDFSDIDYGKLDRGIKDGLENFCIVADNSSAMDGGRNHEQE